MSERPNILVTRPIMDEATATLRERADVTIHENEFGIPRDELLEVIAGRDAIITMLTEQVDAEFLAAAGPNLTIVANHAVGFDNIDVAACTAAGVLATNTPDVLTETTADTAFALLMAAARRLGEGRTLPARASTPWIWGPLMMLGQDVHHKTIGIVGFGRIGQAVARRAKGFGMRRDLRRRVPAPRRRRSRDRRRAASSSTHSWSRRTSSRSTRTSRRRRGICSTPKRSSA